MAIRVYLTARPAGCFRGFGARVQRLGFRVRF